MIMRISTWSDDAKKLALESISDKKLTTKEKVTILRKLFPYNTVTSLSLLLNVHRRTIHRHLLN
jgi:hypothetical protein